MRKSLLVGIGLGVVMLMGAGCSRSKTPVTTDVVTEKTDKVAVDAPVSVSDSVPATVAVGTEEDMDLSLPALQRKPDPKAPVQFAVLDTKDEKLRFRATVTSAKDLKKVFVYYYCVDENGEKTDDYSSAWDNGGKPIVTGKTYEDTLPLSIGSVRCPSVRAANAVYADDSEWSWGVR